MFELSQFFSMPDNGYHYFTHLLRLWYQSIFLQVLPVMLFRGWVSNRQMVAGTTLISWSREPIGIVGVKLKNSVVDLPDPTRSTHRPVGEEEGTEGYPG